MSLTTELTNKVKEQIELLEKTHKWMWDHVDHPKFREQSAKYNALERYNRELIAILGFLQWLNMFKSDIELLEIVSKSYGSKVISMGFSETNYTYEEVARTWYEAAIENYNES